MIDTIDLSRRAWIDSDICLYDIALLLNAIASKLNEPEQKENLEAGYTADGKERL